MYVSYCGIFVKGMVLRYHWCMIFPIEVRKHKCCHKVALASNLHAPCNSHHHKLGFFWTWCQLMIIWSIKRDSTTKDFEDSVGVCKVVALSLLVKQSGFLAPLPPLTAPTLFVALLTGSSLAAECEKLGCAIIIGGADQESKRAANLRSRCGRKRLRRDNCRRFFTARTSTRSTGLEEIGNSLE